jgi:hypothetical protein
MLAPISGSRNVWSAGKPLTVPTRRRPLVARCRSCVCSEGEKEKGTAGALKMSESAGEWRPSGG